MNNTIYTECILEEKLPIKYKLYLIMLSLILLMFLFSQPFKFKTYLNIDLVVKLIDNNYFITTYINDDDIKYLIDNNNLKINDKEYKYKVVTISDKNYVNNKNDIVKLVYIELDIEDKYLIDNYVLTAKIEKENKKIYEYIKGIF